MLPFRSLIAGKRVLCSMSLLHALLSRCQSLIWVAPFFLKPLLSATHLYSASQDAGKMCLHYSPTHSPSAPGGHERVGCKIPDCPKPCTGYVSQWDSSWGGHPEGSSCISGPRPQGAGCLCPLLPARQRSVTAALDRRCSYLHQTLFQEGNAIRLLVGRLHLPFLPWETVTGQCVKPVHLV